MARSIEIDVAPSVLAWARESVGWSISSAAERLKKISPDRLSDLETGKSRPTLVLLKRMAKVYKRPLAAFFLSDPPVEDLGIPDFRALSARDNAEEDYPPSIRFALRKLKYLQKSISEIRSESELGLKNAPRISEDIDDSAKEYRRFLNIPLDVQSKWRTSNKALTKWREALESIGIYVIQLSGIELDDMRGISLSDPSVPLIAINGRDSATSRIFTIFHELAHLVLNHEALCDLEPEEKTMSAQKAVIEQKCNQFSASFLVPTDALLAQPIIYQNRKKNVWPDDHLAKLAKFFVVSREVILRRLVGLGLADSDFYIKKHYQWQEEYKQIPPPPVPTTVAEKCIREKGQGLVSIILNNYFQENISPSEASDFLGVRLKHVDELKKLIRPPSSIHNES